MASKVNVLVIDDDDDIRVVYRRIFKLSGQPYEVYEASSFEVAVDKFGIGAKESDLFDLILCDHHTHGINSYTVFKKLKEMKSLPKAFYIVTGDTSIEKQAGMSGIIYKPVYDRLMALAEQPKLLASAQPS